MYTHVDNFDHNCTVQMFLGELMQVRCVGFHLTPGDPRAPIGSFLRSLCGLPKRPSVIFHEYRILLVHSALVDNFLKGVIFTFNDRKSYLEFVAHAGGRGHIQKKTYDNPPVEANFFVIHDVTNKGVYLQYRGSLSAMNFGKVLGECYKSYGSSLTGKKRLKLKYELLYSRESLDDILDRQMDEISNVEFDASEVYITQSLFDPNGRSIKSSKVRFGFNASLTKRSILDQIINFVRTQNLTFGKVTGSLNGMSRSIDIFENVDLFHVEEFDDLVAHMEAGVDNFQDAPIFDFLIDLVKNDNRIIE